jgi:hypothetical protein
LDESYTDLKKKAKQIDNYLGDMDFRDEDKVSRVSWRNKAEMNEDKNVEQVNKY